MSSAPTAAAIARDATWLVQALEASSARVRLTEMSPDAYRDASFLDDRMLQQPLNAHILPWADVAGSVPADAREDVRWIFHIGHVGSTLVARLLGELEGALSVREPRVLRDVAILPQDERATYVAGLRKLFSRSFARDQVALVKATSFTSEIAVELIPNGSAALFMYATPRAYIQSILAGENSRKELAMLADMRAQRMRDRVGEFPDAHKSEAHLAAAAWACEMTSLASAERAISWAKIEWADFDQMLEDMPGELGKAAAVFGFEASADRIADVATGPLMRRYSKALEYDYSPNLRRQLLEQADGNHRRAIEDAVGMLQQVAATSPLLARALELSHSGN